MRIKQFLLASLLTVAPLISFATDYYITTTELNIRSGAGTGYSVLFTLQKGEEVELLSKESNWYKIKYLENTGYVHSKYLKYSRTTSTRKLNYSQQTISNMLIGAYVILALFVVYIIYGKIRNKILLASVTKSNRGTKAERDLILKLLKKGIPAETIFHDLYLQNANGKFSQIDLVVATEVGMIVFEVKDYSGWIYGDGRYNQWTQVLAFGKKKYRFYNPIKQNNKHIADLRKQLNPFETIPFYSMVVFYGDCVLKDISFVPNGTFLVKSKRVIDVLKLIMKENEPIQYTNKNEVVRTLQEAVKNGEDVETQMQHVEDIKDMLGKDRIFD